MSYGSNLCVSTMCILIVYASLARAGTEACRIGLLSLSARRHEGA